MFTYSYSQPSEYRFSLDSVLFAKFVAEKISMKKNLKDLQVLDLCSGCGVIGFELAWHIRALKFFHFVEVQQIYHPHFQKNISLVNRPELQLQWHAGNYDVLLEENWKNKFDLIISNPPYFLPHQSVLSPSEFKNRCRFFIDSSFENFIYCILNSIAEEGECYFLLRPLLHHGIDLFAIAKTLAAERHVIIEKVTKIRSCDVIRIKNKNKKSGLSTLDSMTVF